MVVFHELVKRLLGLSEEQHREVLAFVEELEKKVSRPSVPRRDPWGILKGQIPEFSHEDIDKAMREYHENCLRQLPPGRNDGSRIG